MQLSLKKRTAGRIEFEILFGFIALVAVAAARFLPVDLFAPACVFKSVTGFPCPACGSTRAVAHLAQGRFSSAVAMNPLVAAGFTAVILAFFYGLLTFLFSAPRLSLALSSVEKDRVRGMAVLVVLLNWVYLLFVL